jgi:hypothetical protein
MAEIMDYKKAYKDLYAPKNQPALIEVAEIPYAAVDGRGDPNDTNGQFPRAVELLYAIQYTIKMSKKTQAPPEGYFDYVVPPLEGFWWTDNKDDIGNKSKYIWTAVIRLPEFVNGKIFEWACNSVKTKKKMETEKARYIKINEGRCVQCLHTGSFDDEPETLEKIEKFMAENDLVNDMSKNRRHHEIYLSDFRKTEKEKLKTILRIPVKKKP